jgi:hypothetical protein
MLVDSESSQNFMTGKWSETGVIGKRDGFASDRTVRSGDDFLRTERTFQSRSYLRAEREVGEACWKKR